ncbi:discoidin domain-containing protein [Paenibacillus frigoriresistens]|nr:discoidin domain-containing protein [Paenibacillus frigoriresistens]
MNFTDTSFYSGVTILPTQIPEPAQRTNLALNKAATASSATGPSSYAVDGNLSTRWGSNYTDSEWIYVDLGTSLSINGVRLNWKTAFGKSYQIQVSNDLTNWSNVYTTTTGDGGIDDISFTPTNARYVRMNGTQRGSIYGYSLWEFEVYGVMNNLATGAVVTGSSSLENSNWSTSKANDG